MIVSRHFKETGHNGIIDLHVITSQEAWGLCTVRIELLKNVVLVSAFLTHHDECQTKSAVILLKLEKACLGYRMQRTRPWNLTRLSNEPVGECVIHPRR